MRHYFLKVVLLPARNISSGDGLKRKRLLQWASEPQQICGYYWLFPDIKSKLCERWWRCSNRNEEWKWANRRSSSIKTQNDNQNKWDYQRTSRRKSARNICSGEAEIKRIIRLWSCAFGKKSMKDMSSILCFAHVEWSILPLYLH